MVNFVLDEEVDEWRQSRKERAREQLSVSKGCGVARGQSQATQSPRQRRYQIRDHEDVVPIMVVGRGHICPSTTCQGPEDANAGDEFG
jgi:poly(3-hydroxybutyrate) depolymerase